MAYADDLLEARVTKHDEEQAQRGVYSSILIKNLGGCHVTRDRKVGTLNCDQCQSVQAVAKVEEMQQIPCRAAVGALVWAATMTQPDLSYAAHQIAKFSGNPGPAHWQAAKKVLQYL